MDKYKEKLIDGFLLGQLNSEEQSEFNRLWEEDAEFKKEVTIMRQIKTGFEKKGERSALNEIQALSSKKEFEKIISNAEKRHRPKSRKVLYTLVSLSAACIIFIMIYVGIQPQYSSTQLYKEFYTVASYENTPIRGGQLLSEEQQNLKINATDLYKKGEYTQALAIYNQLKSGVDDGELPEDILFYSAICLIETNQYDAATDNLDYLFSEGVYFNEQAGWYLALCYLKNGKREKAKEILTKLIDDKTEYENSSRDVLTKINEKKLF